MNIRFVLSAIIETPELRQQLDTNFTEFAPMYFHYERGTERSNQISTVLREEFLNQTIIDERSLAGLNHVNIQFTIEHSTSSY